MKFRARGREKLREGIEEREQKRKVDHARGFSRRKREKVREIERQKMNSEEGDKIEIQEIERKHRRQKAGEIERSREEKKRIREGTIK